jgi:hypothetical protein
MKTSLCYSVALLLAAASPAKAGVKNWTMSAGSPSTAAFSTGCNVGATATTSGYTINGDAFADVALLGSPYKRLVSAVGSVSNTWAGNKSTRKLYGRLDAAGVNIYTYGKEADSLPTTYFTRTFESPYTAKFPVYGIPVTVKPNMTIGLGMRGSAGFSLATLTATASINPAIVDLAGGATATALGGLVGIYGNLTVLRLDPQISGSCDFRYRRANTTGTLSWTGLGGTMGVQATILGYVKKLPLATWPNLPPQVIPLWSEPLVF